jgi:dephospho-CoA kinase
MKLKTEWSKLSPEKRLHKLAVPVVGLTGGIATGKSTVAKILIEKSFPVINADLLVKEIYTHEETKNFIRTNYPDVMKGSEIDFRMLRERVFTAPVVKDEIEAFIYARMPEAFAEAFQKLSSPRMIIYDVPLLFEKQLDVMVDVKVLVYAPAKIQKARLMQRDGHEEAMALTIMSSQMDIEVKKEKSDFVIDNSGTLVELTEEVNQFLRQVFES